VADLPTERISDDERDRALATLREHCVAGRLSLDEFSERIGKALQARTRADLTPLLADLPATLETAPLQPRRGRRWIVAFMSGADAKGRWHAAEHITAVAVMGGCKLDLRGAQIEAPELRITAWAFWGGVDIVLPEGIDVEVSGLSIMGGRSVRTAEVALVPGSPRVTIRAFPIMGGVSVRSKPLRSKEGRTRARGEGRGPLPEAGSPPRAPVDDRQAVLDANSASHLDADFRPSAKPHPNGLQGRGSTRQGVGPQASEPGADGTVTILFSDISDYSGLLERLGDRVVQEMMREHRQMVRSCVASQGGQEVKAQGDGFMLAFAGVARGLRCAAAIQQSLSALALERPERSFSVHMGLHTGEVLVDGDDYAGHTVVLASRLADVAGPREVLVSSVAKQLVARSGEFAFGPVRAVPLKGLTDSEQAAAFLWDRQPVHDS
jgi:class 3 adenylate cyclase